MARWDHPNLFEELKKLEQDLLVAAGMKYVSAGIHAFTLSLLENHTHNYTDRGRG